MLKQNQIKTMFQLQAGMNHRVDANWIESRYPYLRAVVIEAAEAIEHHGWKWWKKQDKDTAQLQMELIDIWHFLLSEILLRNGGDEAKSECYLEAQHTKQANANSLQFDGQTYQLSSMTLLEKLEALIGTAAAGRIELFLFSAIVEDSGLNWHELYRQYVSKNVLNFFRQDHGYQEGSYIKIWNGREDNEVLVEVMNSLDADSDSFKDQLYAALSENYPNN